MKNLISVVFLFILALSLFGNGMLAGKMQFLEARVRCERAQAIIMPTYAAYIAKGGAAVSDPEQFCQYLQENDMLLKYYGN